MKLEVIPTIANGKSILSDKDNPYSGLCVEMKTEDAVLFSRAPKMLELLQSMQRTFPINPNGEVLVSQKELKAILLAINDLIGKA